MFCFGSISHYGAVDLIYYGLFQMVAQNTVPLYMYIYLYRCYGVTQCLPGGGLSPLHMWGGGRGGVPPSALVFRLSDTVLDMQLGDGYMDVISWESFYTQNSGN